MKWLFLHLEKTGGISLGSMVEQNFGCHEYYKYYNIYPPVLLEDFHGLTQNQKKNLRVIIGHFDWGIHKVLEVEGFQYVTVLRNPVYRIVSLYYYIRGEPNFWIYDEVNKMTLEDFIKSGIYKQCDNGQTRRIAGASDVAYKKISRRHLERAKENLKHHFVFVGILERFDETLVLMKRKKIFKKIVNVPWNATYSKQYQKEIPAKVFKLIEETNKFDIELYTFAREIFAETVALQDSAFQEEVEVFRRFNEGNQELFRDYTMGLKFYHEGDLEKSETHFKNALEPKTRKKLLQFPGVLAKNYYYIGDICRRLEKNGWENYFKRSLELLLKKDPQTWEDVYMIGSLYKKMNDFDESRKCFERLIRESFVPYLKAGAFFHLGEMHLQSGDTEDAKELFQKTLKYNPLHKKAGQYLNPRRGKTQKAHIS